MQGPWWLFGLSLLMAGCAESTPPVVKSPPLAEDLVGWSTPVTASETETPGPSAPVEPPTARSPREKVYYDFAMSPVH
jgi:hypothetical protein